MRIRFFLANTSKLALVAEAICVGCFISGFGWNSYAEDCRTFQPEECAAIRDSAAKVVWTKDNIEKLRATFSSEKKVEQFLCTFVHPYDDSDENVHFDVVSRPFTELAYLAENGDTYPESCVNVYKDEYDFLDLLGDGHAELMAIAENGKMEFIVIVEQIGNGFLQRRLVNESESENIGSRLYKEEGKNSFLLIADEILEWPDGWAFADPLPRFMHLYEWNGKDDWVQADTQHKDFYAKEVLPKLLAKQAAGGCPDQEPEVQAKCRYSLEKEIAAVKAILAAP